MIGKNANDCLVSRNVFFSMFPDWRIQLWMMETEISYSYFYEPEKYYA